MHPRNIALLAALLAVLAGAVVYQKNQTPYPGALKSQPVLSFKFDKEQVSAVLVDRAEDKLRLEKSEGQWRIATQWNTAAESQKIETVIQQLGQLSGDLRSSDETLFADYGLGEEEAVRVELRGEDPDQELAVLWVGARGLENASAFVRKPGAPEVFALETPLLQSLGFHRAVSGSGLERDSEFWNDLRLFRQDIGAVEKIEIKRGASQGSESFFSMVKKENREGENVKTFWSFEGQESAFAPDEKKIEDLLQLLGGARALKALDPSKDYGFGRPIAELTLSLKEGEPVIFRAASAGQETKSYYLQSTSDPAVFELPLYHVKRMDLPRRHFFLNNPFGIESADVKEVLLRKNAQEWFAGLTEDKKAALERLAVLLAGLDEEVREVKNPPAWTEPAAAMEVKAQPERSWIFDFGPAAAGRVPFRLAGEPRVFDVSESFFQSLFKDFPPPADA
ncbi:MAG: DUF4340 domain-containing protein [Candidatus Omnitrophica bacterium]|nr:DUF4340 domain-containing protein [Candidatus Omnitrophota bacterium]